jgi:hypothetical protein
MGGAMNHQQRDNFAANAAFSNRHMDEQMRIVKEYIGQVLAPPEVIVCTGNALDTRRSTDVRIKTRGGDVCLRVRRNIGYRDLTIRWSVPSGYPTEIDKLRKGDGDWFFYFWTDDNDVISDWWIIDIEKMRHAGMLERRWPIKPNDDGSSFIIVDYDSLQDARCILVTHTRDMCDQYKRSQCEWGTHEWKEVEGRHGRKIECAKCHKFYGYVKPKSH